MLRTEILTNSQRFSSITQATSLSSTNLLSSRTNHTPKPTISTAQVTPRPAKLLECHVTSAQLRRNRHRSPSPSLLPNHSFVFTHTAPSTSTIPSARSPSKKRIARVKKKKKKNTYRAIFSSTVATKADALIAIWRPRRACYYFCAAARFLVRSPFAAKTATHAN